MITISIISCILYLIIFFLEDLIVKIFNSENNLVLQSIATNGLKLYFIAVIFVGFNIILPMFFSCMEKALPITESLVVILGVILYLKLKI